MRHHQRSSGAEFDGEVAVGNGIERIAAYVVETQRPGHAFAIDREGGAGQRRRAQRQAVDALAAVGHAFCIAAEHFDIGQHVVAEGDRLRHLHVREAGQDGVDMAFGQVEQGEAKGAQEAHDVVDGTAHVEADIGRHLIVARAARMQPLAGVADDFGQALFDVQVHVFQVEQPFELAGRHFVADLLHAALDFRVVGGSDDALVREHLGMRQRAVDIDLRHAVVEKHRGGIAFDEVGNRFGKARRPGFALLGELCSHDVARIGLKCVFQGAG